MVFATVELDLRAPIEFVGHEVMCGCPVWSCQMYRAGCPEKIQKITKGKHRLAMGTVTSPCSMLLREVVSVSYAPMPTIDKTACSGLGRMATEMVRTTVSVHAPVDKQTSGEHTLFVWLWCIVGWWHLGVNELLRDGRELGG